MSISAMVPGNQKMMHFYEAPDIPLLFDLANEQGEVKNIASKKPDDHKTLYSGMVQYLQEVGARFPKKNPQYNPEAYKKAKEYELREKWGPFEGERPLEEDERYFMKEVNTPQKLKNRKGKI